MSLDIPRFDLDSLDVATRRALTHRSAVPDPSILAEAARIVADVGRRGDVALAEYAAHHGGGAGGAGTLVDRGTMTAALAAIDGGTIEAIESAIENVTTVHLPQRPSDDRCSPADGVVVERRWTPLRSVGVYVPGGRALYPSSLIMGVVPARIAGVSRIAVATPARPDGLVDPIVLATAMLLEVDELHAMGGAQAIAALATGTETIERVDKIVGPGGPWVTAAKLAVVGRCAIDIPAGPSEAAIVADGSADPAIVAADAMCQAEHGAESAIVIGVDDERFGEAVIAEMVAALPGLARADIITEALEKHGMVVCAREIDDILAFVDAWAPEHLSLHTADAQAHADTVRNAGSVFVGHWTPEAAGDYATGANHILPTGGLARSHGPLSVEDFGSWRQVQTLDERGLRSLAPTIVSLATAEGLTAHAYAVTARLRDAS